MTDVSVPGVIGGRYETQGLIGRGGMGSVWLAEDQLLGRLVALKEIASLPGESEGETERALREARNAAALNHPNTVALYDAIEHEGTPWLVMEYVSGPTLSEWVREHGPLEPDVAAEVGARLGAGLAAAHRAGVIHRDIKPANVFVGDDGEPKLGDFGTARRVAEERLTLAGVVTGTPSYMAPEVADGGEYTESADVWALGATLYFAVEGEDAYPGTGNALATLRNIATKPPRAPVRAGVLEPVLGQLLSHNPERRGTMGDAVRLLEEVAPGRPGAISLIAAGAGAGAAGAAAASAAGEPAVPEDQATGAHFFQDAGDVEEEPEGTGLFGFPGAPATARASSGRRGPVIAGIAAAALVTAMGVAAFTVGGDDDREATPTSTSSSTSTPSSTSTSSTTSSTTSSSETTPETPSETTTEEVVPAPPPTTRAPEPSATRAPRPAPTTTPRGTSSTSESTSETTSETSEPSETSESTTSEPTSSSTSSTSTPDRPSPTSTPDRPSPTSEFTPNPPRPTSGGGSPERSTSSGSRGSTGTD